MSATGIQAVMGRIAAIREIAGQAGGGFAGALGTAVAAHQAPSTLGASPLAASTAPTSVPSPSVGRTPIGPTTPATPPAAPETVAGAGALPAGAARWQASIERAARQEGIDPKLLTAVVWAESDFRPDAVSHAGAIGLAQLMPGTADLLGVDPYDPDQNLAGGARFLRSMLDTFGRVDLALAAYNAGPARVASLHDGGPGVPVSEGYVATVLDRYRTLGGTP